MTSDSDKSKIMNEYFHLKQSFLSDAISDLAGNIRFIDTKVSIIMAAIVAMIGGVLASINSVKSLIQSIFLSGWPGNLITLLFIVCLISTVCVLFFGINTIKGRTSKSQYDSKWFITKSLRNYSIEAYKNDILKMNSNDIIENMIVELYKLNDINQQKMKTMKCVTVSFNISLIAAVITVVILLIVGG